MLRINPSSLYSDIVKFAKEDVHAIAIAKCDIESEQAMELNRILQENNSKKDMDEKNDAFLL